MKLIKRGKVVHIADDFDRPIKPLRDATGDEFDEFTLTVGPLGPKASFFGFHPDTYLFYVVTKSEDLQTVIDSVQRGDSFPIFAIRRPIGGMGTLEMFWRNKANKHITKLLAGAMQFIRDADNEKLYITHMSVRPKWRRNRLNWHMVESVRDDTPDYEVVFDDPTEMGRKFMKKYQG